MMIGAEFLERVGHGHLPVAKPPDRSIARRCSPTIGCHEKEARGQDMYRIGSLMLAALLVAGGALAQDNYPTQTVKFVLPSAPGSTTDILTRLTADGLGRKWG